MEQKNIRLGIRDFFFLDDGGKIWFDWDELSAFFQSSASGESFQAFRSSLKRMMRKEDVLSDASFGDLYSFNCILYLSLDFPAEESLIISFYQAMTENGYSFDIEDFLLDSVIEKKMADGNYSFLDSYGDMISELSDRHEREAFHRSKPGSLFSFDLLSFNGYLHKRFSFPLLPGETILDYLDFLDDYVRRYDYQEDVCDQASSLLYSFVTRRPLKQENDVYAVVCLLCYLNENSVLDDSFSPSCLRYVIGRIHEMDVDKEEENVREVRRLLFEERPKEKKPEYDFLLETYVSTKDEKDLVRAFIGMVENYHGSQGYYEYFAGRNGSLMKLHYSGRIQRICFNPLDTMMKGRLCFEVHALVDMEAPSVLEDRHAYISERYAEVKTRFYKDVIEAGFKKEIERKLKEYGIEKIPFPFEFDMIFSLGDVSDDF